MNSLLKKYYFLRNPVNMARNTEKEMERPSYSLTYGETPYSTALSIFNMVKVKDNDVFFDLGSGTGNVALFINIYFNIKSTGIDLVSYFIEKSNLIAEEMKLEHIRFIKGDFLEEDLSEGTIFYMNCLTFNQELREKLAEKMNLIKEGSRIISIGYPLAGFNLLEKRTYFFSWGWEDVYIQEK
jgi:CRISPR-associated protein Cas8b1/Cst1 subtype I-B